MKKTFAVFFVLAATFCAAQGGPRNLKPADSPSADAALKKSAAIFPKFYAMLQDARAHDALVRNVVLLRSEKPQGPAFAQPPGTVRIDISFIENPRPLFDDNRMIVVVEHEIGHLHYFHDTPRGDWNPENSEKAAFEYSLKKTREMAEKGDCLPLQAGLKFMKMRSEGSNLADAHVRALKRMVNEPLYAEYVSWAQTNCSVTK